MSVNEYVIEVDTSPDISRVDEEQTRETQFERLESVKAERNGVAVEAALKEVCNAAENDENTILAIVDAVSLRDDGRGRERAPGRLRRVHRRAGRVLMLCRQRPSTTGALDCSRSVASRRTGRDGRRPRDSQFAAGSQSDARNASTRPSAVVARSRSPTTASDVGTAPIDSVQRTVPSAGSTAATLSTRYPRPT